MRARSSFSCLPLPLPRLRHPLQPIVSSHRLLLVNTCQACLTSTTVRRLRRINERNTKRRIEGKAEKRERKKKKEKEKKRKNRGKREKKRRRGEAQRETR